MVSLDYNLVAFLSWVRMSLRAEVIQLALAPSARRGS